jgi:hypothetical protein
LQKKQEITLGEFQHAMRGAANRDDVLHQFSLFAQGAATAT